MIFNNTYRGLTKEEKDAVKIVKDKAQELYDLLFKYGNVRCSGFAIEKLEECVMWAVKGITS